MNERGKTFRCRRAADFTNAAYKTSKSLVLFLADSLIRAVAQLLGDRLPFRVDKRPEFQRAVVFLPIARMRDERQV